MFRRCPTSSKWKKKRHCCKADLTFKDPVWTFPPQTRHFRVLVLLAASPPLPLPLVAISSHPDVHHSRRWSSQKYDNRLPGKLIYFSRKKKKKTLSNLQVPLHIHLLTPLLSTAVTLQVRVAMEKSNYSKWTPGSFYSPPAPTLLSELSDVRSGECEHYRL